MFWWFTIASKFIPNMAKALNFKYFYKSHNKKYYNPEHTYTHVKKIKIYCFDTESYSIAQDDFKLKIHLS